MNCPKCGSEQIFVLNSRPYEGGIRRRRECAVCKLRFNSYEYPDVLAKTVRLDLIRNLKLALQALEKIKM